MQTLVRDTVPSKQIGLAANYTLHLVQSLIFPTIPKNSQRFKFLVAWLQKSAFASFVWFMLHLSPLPSWPADSVHTQMSTYALWCRTHVLSPLSALAFPSFRAPNLLTLLYRAMQLCIPPSQIHCSPPLHSKGQTRRLLTL